MSMRNSNTFKQKVTEGLENSNLGLTSKEANTIGQNPLIAALAIFLLVGLSILVIILAIIIFQAIIIMFTGQTMSPY